LRALVAALPFTLHARRQRAITLALKAAEAPHAPYSAYADVILENATPETISAGEICPEYALLSAETFAKMAELSPNVRFIFLMRDPVSRFVSGVRHSLRKTLGKKAKVTALDLSKAIARFSRPNARPIALSRYDVTMEALERSVPADRILYVFFEEMFDQDQIRRICEFLGVRFVPAKVAARANSAGKSQVAASDADCASIARKLAPVYEFAKARFGDALPSNWMQSAALARVAPEQVGG
jgi:hypothetical protein